LQLSLESGDGIQRRFPALDSSASFQQVSHGHKAKIEKATTVTSVKDTLDMSALSTCCG